MRTTITQNNPESTFGEISRIVGNEVFIICFKPFFRFVFFILLLTIVSKEDYEYISSHSRYQPLKNVFYPHIFRHIPLLKCLVIPSGSKFFLSMTGASLNQKYCSISIQN